MAEQNPAFKPYQGISNLQHWLFPCFVTMFPNPILPKKHHPFPHHSAHLLVVGKIWVCDDFGCRIAWRSHTWGTSHWPKKASLGLSYHFWGSRNTRVLMNMSNSNKPPRKTSRWVSWVAKTVERKHYKGLVAKTKPNGSFTEFILPSNHSSGCCWPLSPTTCQEKRHIWGDHTSTWTWDSECLG